MNLPGPGTATCGFCGEMLPLEAIVAHVERQHRSELSTADFNDDGTLRFAEWPDGSPVIVDETLEPRDFRP